MDNSYIPSERTLALRRKRRRKRKIIRFLFFAFVLAVLIFAIVFTVKQIERSRKLNVKTLEMPDYVTVDLIHKGGARSGIKLKRINGIVVHYTGNAGSSAKNNRDYFDDIRTKVCSHFIIGIDGEIIECVPIDEKSAASNNRNSDTISIEVCHSDESGKFSDKAYDALVKLTAFLCDNSDLSPEDIIRHYDVTGKECPKYYVDHPDKWEDFIKDVSKKRGL